VQLQSATASDDYEHLTVQNNAYMLLKCVCLSILELTKLIINQSKLYGSRTLHCVSKNDSDVAHYNFSAHQPILLIYGRDIAERICYSTVICYPTSPN